MKPDRITLAHILQAATMADIDAACAFCQGHADITAGDGAGYFFSGGEFETWPTMRAHDRFMHLCAWLRFEAQVEA